MIDFIVKSSSLTCLFLLEIELLSLSEFHILGDPLLHLNSSKPNVEFGDSHYFSFFSFEVPLRSSNSEMREHIVPR